ncbi:hypothetical protein MTO96_014645 [Rhipicephalus appendiculatus]
MGRVEPSFVLRVSCTGSTILCTATPSMCSEEQWDAVPRPTGQEEMSGKALAGYWLLMISDNRMRANEGLWYSIEHAVQGHGTNDMLKPSLPSVISIRPAS